MRTKRSDTYMTIKDVAKEAGVSISTVSRVLNNGKSVKYEKRKKVLMAIEKLDYVPNSAAQNLASVHYVKKIIFLLPDLTNYYIPLIKGIKEGALIYDFEIVIDYFNNDFNQYKSQLNEHANTSEVKGIIQFAHKIEVDHKIIINLLEDKIDLQFNNKLNLDNQKVGFFNIYDHLIIEFISKQIMNGITIDKTIDKTINQFDKLIITNINDALEVINLGYKGQIILLEDSMQIVKIHPNTIELDIDFYKLGVYLSRFLIKKIKKIDTSEFILNVSK